MLNKSKRRRVLGLALLPITLLLSVAIGWLYLTVQSGYGTSAAFVVLTAVTIIILGLICKGIQYAAAIEKAVQVQSATQINLSETRKTVKSFAVESSEQTLYQQPQVEFNAEMPATEMNDENPSEIFESNSQPRKHRGKQSRFPISKITQAVLRWEQRDPQFTSVNLTEFLEQEFGSGPDGILLMAPTTFYDWRRRILSDLRAKNKARSNNAGVKTH